MRTRPLKVALLGCGVVGSEVARIMTTHADDLAARIGAPVELAGVAVRRPSRVREGIDPALVTTDATALVKRGDIDVVVEVIGGIEPARTLITTAFEYGASVVSANKALLAQDGAALHAAAEAHGEDLYYEASVAGAIPLIRPLRESLAGDKVNRVLGIVNGTTNFILDKMDSTGAGYQEALDEATALGYAEADPTADVEAFDAAAKAAILAGIAFHTRVRLDDVYREGMTEVTASDFASAREMGCTIKLLAICERAADGGSVTARVHPAMIPLSHPLASVRGAYNAVFVESDAAGQLMFYGPGAAWCSHRLRRARRPRRRLPQPAQRGNGARRVGVCRPAGVADGRRRHALPHQSGRRRQTGCSRPGGDRVRRARGVHRYGAPARATGQRRRGLSRRRHPPRVRRLPHRDRRGAAQARHRAGCRQHHAG